MLSSIWKQKTQKALEDAQVFVSVDATSKKDTRTFLVEDFRLKFEFFVEFSGM